MSGRRVSVDGAAQCGLLAGLGGVGIGAFVQDPVFELTDSSVANSPIGFCNDIPAFEFTSEVEFNNVGESVVQTSDLPEP